MSAPAAAINWSADAVATCEAMLERNSKADEKGHKIWTAATMAGNGKYGTVKFQKHTTTAHRLAYLLHMRLPKLDSDLVVRHLCGNSLCVEPSHLSAGTARENAADKIGHRTSAHGTNAKISILTARAIKNSKAEGTQKDRAAQFGVSKSIVNSIDCGATWAWLGKVEEEDNKNIHCTKTSKNRAKKRKAEDEEFSHEDRKRARTYILERTTNPASETLCMMWQGTFFIAGYGMATFARRKHSAHRLSYIAFYNIPFIPVGMQVRHKCKNKSCVNPFHLELGTAKDNAADRVRDGTQTRGETNHNAQITEDTARAILKSKGEGTQKERAARFGATVSIVADIDRGANWKHLRAQIEQ